MENCSGSFETHGHGNNKIKYIESWDMQLDGKQVIGNWIYISDLVHTQWED